MSDTGFSENRTDLKVQKPKTQLSTVLFAKTDNGALEMVFHNVSFTIHHPHDVINSQSIFLHVTSLHS